MDLIIIILMLILLVAGLITVNFEHRKKNANTRLATDPQAASQQDHEPDQTLPPQRGVHLRQVYPDKTKETETDIDIIAIHGLDTKSPETWTWVDQKNPTIRVNWLEDRAMLPSTVDRVRIFTCDWPADLLQPSKLIQMEFLELALRLSAGIQSRPPGPSSGASRDRPILFIASCLGGIMLIKALVDAGKQDNPLRRATRGIIFLATPFQGTSFEEVATWAVPCMEAWALVQRREVTKLLASVKKLDLDALVRNFTQLIKQQDPPCEVFNFYEKRVTSLPSKIFPWLPTRLRQEKLLVDRVSATLEMVPDPLPLDQPHVLMNKFKGPECTDYKLVVGQVQRILGNIRDGSPLEQADVWIREKHYTEDRLKIDRLSGERLMMEQCYINLAIVEQPRVDAASSGEPGNQEISPTSSHSSLRARLRVETPAEDIQVELGTLFDPRKGPNGLIAQPKRIMIRGRAGVGKTTLCKKIIHDFQQGAWNDIFHRILWVPLRKLKTWNADKYTLGQLFHHEYFPGSPNGKMLSEALWRDIDAGNGKKTLFILDGLDEVAGTFDPETNKHQLLITLLNQPNVVITCRPHGALVSNLHPVSLELETVGFYPDQMNDYIEMALQKRPRHEIDEVQSFLKDHFLIQDLMRIPIQLDALCYTWDRDYRIDPQLQTMTAIYHAIEHNLWKKDVVRLGKKDRGDPVTSSQIQSSSAPNVERLVRDEILFLEGLAFTGIYSDVINFDIKQLEDIYETFKPENDFLLEKTLPNLSFLRTSDQSSEYKDQNYHFLHLTIQEYFAARYFVRCWKSGKEIICLKLNTGRSFQKEYPATDYLQEQKHNVQYDIVWRFVTGLLQGNGSDTQLPRFFYTIEKEPRDLLGPVHQRLIMHCLSEVVIQKEPPSFTPLRKQLEIRLSQWVLFECNSTGHGSQLAREIELPEQVLNKILPNESKDISGLQIKVLRSIADRNKQPLSIVRLANDSLTQSDVSLELKVVALRILGNLYKGSSSNLGTIVALLKNNEVYVRMAAVEALAKQPALSPELLETIVALLKDKDSSVRKAAVSALAKQQALSLELLEAIVALFKDKYSFVREAAVNALAKQQALSPELLEAIVALLKDNDMFVRMAAVDALAKQQALSLERLEAKVAHLKDNDMFVRMAAVDALAKQPALSLEPLEAIVALLKDNDMFVRRAAVDALAKQQALSPELLEAIVALLKDNDIFVRMAAVNALAKQPALSPKFLEAIVAHLKDKDYSVRRVAVDALAKQPALSSELLEAIVALLKDNKASVRSAAVNALAKQPALSPELLEAIVALLKDNEESVREAALYALAKQPALSPELLEAIVALLKDNEESVREAALYALAKQPALSSELLEAIISLLKDNDMFVRRAAVDALAKQPGLSLELVGKDIESFYRSWVERSLLGYTSWYIMDKVSYIDMLDSRLYLEGKQDQLRVSIKEAQQHLCLKNGGLHGLWTYVSEDSSDSMSIA
ncbi:hypothetical protein BP6252_11957 [Coleophoma cylindrospora]|uniref:NACHT domain-containing protein n=1 Tax=Coleophoma cylindrospora TaxID=1849047 RepID=A0A3D8QGN3_9HELO|nr:hypothetical protein BP6252_11957 [Coleophoma cylindrospora]